MKQVCPTLRFYGTQDGYAVDQLNAHVEDILHDQGNINQLQSQFNNELALQIEVINDALDQLCGKIIPKDSNHFPTSSLSFHGGLH